MLNSLSPTVVLLLMIFLVILAVAWLLLPFAMFGIKPLLRQLVSEQRRTRELLERQRSEHRT